MKHMFCAYSQTWGYKVNLVCYSSTLIYSLLYLFNIHSNKVGYNINIQPLINMAMFGYL